jgi:predicted nucleic acid-binding protein
MLVVVADTSPIRYLLQIGQIDLLHRLFGELWIPLEVSEELRDSSAPTFVQSWIKDPPEWLNVIEVSETDDPELQTLDLASGQQSRSELRSKLTSS